MKNLTAIAGKADIHDYVMAMWKTDLFRNSHRNGGIVRNVVEQFAYLPRLFCEMTSDHLERAHFATWWGVLVIRDDYDNPYIHDLYWLHEFYHAGNMPYLKDIGKVAFDEKMQRNELEASVFSEIQIYLEMPELRARSFNHPIYADTFLQDPSIQALWKQNPKVAVETLRAMRRHVMVSKPEHLMDRTERWVRRFAEQNAAYSITWADRYLEVEDRMARLQVQAATDRVEACRLHRAWIEQEAARDPIDNIPFRQEAELFSPFYWATKAKYQEEMSQADEAKDAA